jgi:nucleotidyltransferase/DNA polymerase involved in DNA repair
MPNRIVYIRLPGLLSYVASQQRRLSEGVPVAIAEGRMLRDVSPAATAYGVRAGQSVIQGRRFCPALLVAPLSEVAYRTALRTLLDVLADVSPVVEPIEPDGAYTDLSACGGTAQLAPLRGQIENVLSFAQVVIGEGKSRLTAKACAECKLPADRLSDASVHWLTEDAAIVARLSRLGLSTFGAVAELPESFLVYQFGKVGRLLHQRANGNDLTPVKALYPHPRVDAFRDYTLEPLENKERFHTHLSRLVQKASTQLSALGRYGRRVRLWAKTEREECHREAVLASPVQEAPELGTIARRLSEQMRFSAAVVALRLMVEELDVPVAVTRSLFDEQEVKNRGRLEAVKRRLISRFGQRSLMHLKDLPIPVRDERRVLVREMRGCP